MQDGGFESGSGSWERAVPVLVRGAEERVEELTLRVTLSPGAKHAHAGRARGSRGHAGGRFL